MKISYSLIAIIIVDLFFRLFLDTNVLWTFFNGEAFDYIGSQRVAYDIARGMWPPTNPLSPKDINLHIELGQIGGSLQLFKDNSSWPLYAYAPYEEFPKIPAKVSF